MILNLPQSIKTFFWRLFPFIFILHSIYKLFFSLEIQKFGFTELEDLGRVLFELAISACESALIVIVIWSLFRLWKRKMNHLKRGER